MLYADTDNAEVVALQADRLGGHSLGAFEMPLSASRARCHVREIPVSARYVLRCLGIGDLWYLHSWAQFVLRVELPLSIDSS